MLSRYASPMILFMIFFLLYPHHSIAGTFPRDTEENKQSLFCWFHFHISAMFVSHCYFSTYSIRTIANCVPFQGLLVANVKFYIILHRIILCIHFPSFFHFLFLFFTEKNQKYLFLLTFNVPSVRPHERIFCFPREFFCHQNLETRSAGLFMRFSRVFFTIHSFNSMETDFMLFFFWFRSRETFSLFVESRIGRT